MRELIPGIEPITHLAFSPDGRLLAVAGYESVGLAIWPSILEEGEEFLLDATEERIAQVAWHPRSHQFATAGLDRGIVQVRDRYLRVTRDLAGLPGQNGPVNAVSFTPDGEYLAFANGWWAESPMLTLLSTRTFRVARQLEPNSNQIGAMVFSRDGLLLTGSADRTVVTLAFSPGEIVRTARALASPVQALALHAADNRLAVAAGNAVYLWDVKRPTAAEPQEQTQCLGHRGEVRATSFAPDGRTLASVGKDGTLRFWEASTGLSLATLDLGMGSLRTVSYAPDGLTVLAAGDAGRIVIVDTPE